jgi:subtilisin family serine protease
MTRLVALLVLALAVLALGDSRRAAGPLDRGPGAHVVVHLASPPLAHAPAGSARIEAEHRAFRAELARRLPQARVEWSYKLVTNGVSVVLPEAQVPRLHELAGVRDVFSSTGYGPQLDATPQQIGAAALWGAGLATAGQGTKIGIIDSGLDHTHPFFDPAGYTMPAGFPKGQTRYTNAKVIVARAFAPPSAKTREARLPFDGDNSSHGTHVAGIAAGNPNTRTGGPTVSGVAPRAYLGNYKALVRTDTGLSPNGNSPELVAAIEAAVRDGMDVLNLSIGEPEIEPSRDVVALALDAAAAAGVVPVVAAGNDNNDFGAGSVSSPANSERSITVGAVDIAGSPARRVYADFSSVGPTTMSLRLKPDVSAPGVDVISSVPDGWAGFSGTSMASPHVAGAAALLVQRHPQWTVAQVKSALVQTGVDARNPEGGLIGPAFQGGGVVALGDADRPLLFATPSGVSLGLLARGSTVRRTIRLEDAAGGAGQWQVTAGRHGRSPGGGRVLVPATVAVPGTLTLEVAVPARAAEGDLAGYVVLRRAGEVRRVPFWGRVSVAALRRHRVLRLSRPGTFSGTTRGHPALVTRYRYPESPDGVGLTTVLKGPEAVYRFRLQRRVANFGVVVTSRGRGSRVEPRVVAGLDENRLTGYAGLPIHHNPYDDRFRSPVLAAAALSPSRGDYGIVFDSGGRRGAGRFTFRFWVHDVTRPKLRVRARVVRSGRPLLVSATDAGSGIDPASIRASVDGQPVGAPLRRGVIRLQTGGLSPGPHRLRLRVSDYQETKNTENVARILPNTRTLTGTFTIR